MRKYLVLFISLLILILLVTACNTTININTQSPEDSKVEPAVTPEEDSKPEETKEAPSPSTLKSSVIGYWLAEDPEYHTAMQLTLNEDNTCEYDILGGEIDSSGNVEPEEGTDAFWFDKGTYTVKSESDDEIEILCALTSEYVSGETSPETYKLLFSIKMISDNRFLARVSDENYNNVEGDFYFYRSRKLDNMLFEITDPEWKPITASNPQPIPDVAGEEFTGYTGVHYYIPDGFIDVPGQLGNTGKEDVAAYMYYNPDLDMTIDVLIEGNEYDDVHSAMREKYDQESSIDGVAYSVFKENFYVVSGLEDRRVYYNKAIYEHSDYLYFLFFEYPKENKNPCDGILEEFVKSFEVIR